MTAPQAERSASAELAQLLARQAQLAAHVDELGASQRAAAQAVEAASVGLAELERSALGGERVSPRRRADVEDRLLQARTTAAAPWAERRAGAQRAVEDARVAVQVFAGAHLDALLAELEEQGRAAADAVDRAARDLVEA